MAEIPDRRGLNEAEAAIARAAVASGVSSDLLEGLEPGAARALCSLVEEFEDAAEEWRREVVEVWDERRVRTESTRDETIEANGPWAAVLRRFRGDDTSVEWIESGRMRRALGGLVRQEFLDRPPAPERRLSEDPEHFDAVVRMDADTFRELVTDFGVFQAARLLRDRNRRRIARVARQLSGARRELFLDALQYERDVERRELARLREVFVTLSEHYEKLSDRLEELGLYAVARAASRRFRRRIVRLSEQLPEELGARLVRYYRMSYASTRRGVGWHMRDSLEAFLAWRRERRETRDDDAEGG